MRTLASLEKRCRNFLREAYNLDLNVPISINSDLSRILGRFIFTENNTNNRIEFSERLIKHGTEQQIISVLKHECIHLALYTLGRDYKDGQKEFESELVKHGSDSTSCIKITKREDG